MSNYGKAKSLGFNPKYLLPTWIQVLKYRNTCWHLHSACRATWLVATIDHCLNLCVTYKLYKSQCYHCYSAIKRNIKYHQVKRWSISRESPGECFFQLRHKSFQVVKIWQSDMWQWFSYHRSFLIKMSHWIMWDILQMYHQKCISSEDDTELVWQELFSMNECLLAIITLPLTFVWIYSRISCSIALLKTNAKIRKQ